jgi:hypothetical protein
VEGAAVADATDGTEREVLLGAVLAPSGVPAHAAVSMIIAAQTIDRFMSTNLFSAGVLDRQQQRIFP